MEIHVYSIPPDVKYCITSTSHKTQYTLHSIQYLSTTLHIYYDFPLGNNHSYTEESHFVVQNK